jgi:hypothetical protein
MALKFEIYGGNYGLMKGEANVGNIEIYKLLEKEKIAAKDYCIYPGIQFFFCLENINSRLLI